MKGVWLHSGWLWVYCECGKQTTCTLLSLEPHAQYPDKFADNQYECSHRRICERFLNVCMYFSTSKSQLKKTQHISTVQPHASLGTTHVHAPPTYAGYRCIKETREVLHVCERPFVVIIYYTCIHVL